MFQNKWWLPFRIGFPLACAGGLYACSPQYDDLHFFLYYHLYRSAGIIVARHIDYYAMLLVCALFAIIALFAFIGRLNARVQDVARPVLIACIIVFLAIAAHLHQYALMLLQPIWLAVAGFVRRISLISCIAGGGGVLLLITLGCRQWNRLLQQRNLFLQECARRAWSAGHRMRTLSTRPLHVARVTGCHLLNLVSLTGMVAFLAVNIATGYFYTTSAVALKTRPNVIMIMVDTLRADHVGCYGYRLNTTPNIDRLARESTLYSAAVAQAPWTLWSVFSFMSSRFPDAFQVGVPLPLREYRFPRLAEIMKDQGYATSAVVSNSVLEKFPEFALGFDAYDMSTMTEMERSSSPDVTAIALDQLRRLKDKKFFLFLLYVDPHDPYISHAGFPTASRTPDKLSHAPRHDGSRPSHCQVAAGDMARYDSEIAFTDYHVGRVLEALKQQGLYDDSLIVFLSDHGEEFQEHGRTGHEYTLYDEVLEVPLTIKMPRQRQGRVVDGTFPLIDLFPTILGTLNAGNPAYRTVGTDMGTAHLERYPDRPIFSSTVMNLYSVRTSKYKYIVSASSATQELYSLLADPWEQRNLAGTVTDALATLRKLLQARDEHSPVLMRQHEAPTTFTPAYNKDQIDRLRSLGYMQ